MRITELLKQESIGLNVSVSTKEEAIDKLVDLMDAGGRLKDKAGYKEGILARVWRLWWCRRAWIMRPLTVPWLISCL